MLTDLLGIEVFETSESLAVEENKDCYDFCLRKSSRFIPVDFTIADGMILQLGRKILAKVIGKAENFSNFIVGNHIGRVL